MNKPLIVLTLLGLVLMSGCTSEVSDVINDKEYCIEECAEQGFGYTYFIGTTKENNIKCICSTEKTVVIIE